jgi:flagellar biosynthesis GTPase FlhF
VPALEPPKQEYAPLTAAVERLTERIHELERALNEEKRMRQEQEREWKRDKEKEKERKVREDEEKEKRAKMDQDRTPQSSDRKAEEKKANEEKKAVQVHAPSTVTEAKEREQKTVPPRTSSGVPANANASASTVPGSIIPFRATPTAPLIRQPVALTYRPLNLPPHTIVADEKGPTIRAEDIRAWVQECVLTDATTGKRIREWIRESVLAEVDDVYS